jgi:hypothetical protein
MAVVDEADLRTRVSGSLRKSGCVEAELLTNDFEWWSGS